MVHIETQKVKALRANQKSAKSLEGLRLSGQEKIPKPDFRSHSYLFLVAEFISPEKCTLSGNLSS